MVSIVFVEFKCVYIILPCTLKTPGSAVTRKRVHWGQTPFRQRWPGNQSNWQIMGSDWPSTGSYFASSWLISESSLTRNGVWPQWTPFRVTLARVFLECAWIQKPRWRVDSIFHRACILNDQHNFETFFRNEHYKNHSHIFLFSLSNPFSGSVSIGHN